MNSMMGSQNDEPGILEVLSRALKESQNSTTRLQTELNIALEKSKELEKENARLRADVVQLSDTKNLKLEHVDTQVPVMSDEVCRLTKSNDELKETITALNVKAEEAQGELKAAQEHLAQFSTKYSQIKQRKKDLNEELHAATERVAELESAITDLHDKYVKCKQSRKDIQRELKDTKEQHESWQLMKEDSLKIHNKIETLAFHLPLFSARPNFTNLLPIAKDIGIDILEFLRVKAPTYHW
ncbi:hypothetical protein GGU10DRAFT_360263 [Lentinula aff. detonsa]|uniref:HAP1 N-terminal domain-containing protein n=1 Tax=Lentinula aff. detonsa TaxID=2804958 RepID=A0AA38L3I3_9AGAR|nr:hypothetical protein GGU10DRAFT_360263 [Lentinula aff. detonsa]